MPGGRAASFRLRGGPVDPAAPSKPIMAAAKRIILSNQDSRRLIARLLRENFRRYLGRYLLAFLLMGATALATALSVFMMKAVTTVVFDAPDAAGGALPELPGWLGDSIPAISRQFLPENHGLFVVACVSIGIVLIFLVKGFSEYGSKVILNRIGNNIIARQQRNVGLHLLDDTTRSRPDAIESARVDERAIGGIQHQEVRWRGHA